MSDKQPIKSWENKVLTDKQKERIVKQASKYFKKILELYGWDVDNDPNLLETPKRIAKSWFEIFKGSFDPMPKVTGFPVNEMDIERPTIYSTGTQLDQASPVFVGPIRIFSMCSHHFLPIIGYAYVEYLPKNQVIGLSKIPRIVDWIARRPSIQEKMTELIGRTIRDLTQSPVYVFVEAKHMCTAMRGVEEENATMCTEWFYDYSESELEAVRQRVQTVRKTIEI